MIPENLLDSRYNNEGVLDVLIQWMDQPQHESTWIIAKDFSNQYPDFKLEDKLRLNGGGIDKPHKVYYMKRRVEEESNKSTVGV